MVWAKIQKFEMADPELKKSKVSMMAMKSQSHTRSHAAFGSKSMSRMKMRKGSFGFTSVPGIRPVERTSQVIIVRYFLLVVGRIVSTNTSRYQDLWCRGLGLKVKTVIMQYNYNFNFMPWGGDVYISMDSGNQILKGKEKAISWS